MKVKNYKIRVRELRDDSTEVAVIALDLGKDHVLDSLTMTDYSLLEKGINRLVDRSEALADRFNFRIIWDDEHNLCHEGEYDMDCEKCRAKMEAIEDEANNYYNQDGRN